MLEPLKIVTAVLHKNGDHKLAKTLEAWIAEKEAVISMLKQQRSDNLKAIAVRDAKITELEAYIDKHEPWPPEIPPEEHMPVDLNDEIEMRL